MTMSKKGTGRGLTVRHTAKEEVAGAGAKPDGYVPGLDDEDGEDLDAMKKSATRGLFASQRGAPR